MRNTTLPVALEGGQTAGGRGVAYPSRSWTRRGAAEGDGPPAQGPRRIRLSDLPAGASGRVCGLAGEPAVCVRLREIGFCESAVIEKIAGTRMLICQLCETRIALSDAAASHILVEPI